MTPRGPALIVAFVLTLLTAPLTAWGQPAGKVPQVGVLLFDTEVLGISQSARYFVEGLRELGWIDGQNIALRFKFAALSQERLGALAQELVREKVDLIVTVGTAATRAARQATSAIPIVMAGVGDPVGSGIVTNLARPAVNITGTSLLVQELGGKRLEMLREVLPKLKRVAVLYSAVSPRTTVTSLEATAPRLGLELQGVVFRGPDALPDQFGEMRAARAGALLVSPHPDIDEARARIAELAMKERLPTMFAFREYVEAGGLMSYGSNLAAHHRRAATYVDKILKGASPGGLPIEQPTTFELVVSLKTAKALSIRIPPSMLLRADRVIE